MLCRLAAAAVPTFVLAQAGELPKTLLHPGDPFDCGIGLGQWWDSWDEPKMKWCCVNRVQCPQVSSETAGTVSVAPLRREQGQLTQVAQWSSSQPKAHSVLQFKDDLSFTTDDGNLHGNWDVQQYQDLVLHVDGGDRLYRTDDKGRKFVSADKTATLEIADVQAWWSELYKAKKISLSTTQVTDPPTLPPTTTTVATTTSKGETEQPSGNMEPVHAPPGFAQVPSTTKRVSRLVPYSPPHPHAVPDEDNHHGVPDGLPVDHTEATTKPAYGPIPGTVSTTEAPPDDEHTTEPSKEPAAGTTPIVVVVHPSGDDGIDCDDGLASWWDWSKDKQDYCCKDRRVECPEIQFDCEEDVAGMESWSANKAAYCCEMQELACPQAPADFEEDSAEPAKEDYDCDIRPDNLYTMWSELQKEVCCAEKNVACQDTLEPIATPDPTTAPPPVVHRVHVVHVVPGQVVHPAQTVHVVHPAQNVHVVHAAQMVPGKPYGAPDQRHYHDQRPLYVHPGQQPLPSYVRTGIVPGGQQYVHTGTAAGGPQPYLPGQHPYLQQSEQLELPSPLAAAARSTAPAGAAALGAVVVFVVGLAVATRRRGTVAAESTRRTLLASDGTEDAADSA